MCSAAAKCKVKVDEKTGVIAVNAGSVGNDPLWGYFAGQENFGFADTGTCITGGKLKSCHLGAPGTPAEVTPPPTCRIFIVDDGPDACSATVPGCSVGFRPFVDFVTSHPDTPLAVVNQDADGSAAEFRGNADSGAAVVVTNSGTGGGIYSSTSPTGEWSAVVGYQGGTERYAAEFEATNDANFRAALYARTSGTGSAIDAEVNANTTADALYARTTSNNAASYAGYFEGKVHVAGTLSKTAGSFRIDHPLDPERKYLSHSFVESPDMMNVYNGNVTLGPDGTAVVVFPAWFEALNRDFRYQLTPIGAPGDPYVAQEVAGNAFTIAGTPGLRVSWQVTGIRQDPYAEAHRIPVETDKPPAEVGTYLHPDVYGQPRSRGLSELERPILPPAPKPEPESDR